MSKWTRFWDMASGGNEKEKYSLIYIEAPQDEAVAMFESKFGHNPYNVTCECCGEDYAVDEHNCFEEASAFHRGCEWSNLKGDFNKRFDYQTVEEHKRSDKVLIINKQVSKIEPQVSELNYDPIIPNDF